MRAVRITSANTNSLDRAWADQCRYVAPGEAAIVQSHPVRLFPIWRGAPSASHVQVRDRGDDGALWVLEGVKTTDIRDIGGQHDRRRTELLRLGSRSTDIIHRAIDASTGRTLQLRGQRHDAANPATTGFDNRVDPVLHGHLFGRPPKQLRVERDCSLSVCDGQINPTGRSMPFEPVVHKALLRKSLQMSALHW